MPKEDSILTIRLGALGDIIGSFPVMQAIRAHHKNAHIVALTTPPFSTLLASSPWCDDVWIIKRWTWRQPSGWIKFAHTLRAKNFTQVYDLQRNDRTRIMSYLAPAYLQKRWYGRKGSAHIPILGELRSENIPSVENLDTSWMTADIKKFSLADRYALIVPGSSPAHPYKRWPASHYAQMINHLHIQGIAAILIGTAAEEGVLTEIKNLAPTAMNLCGQTNLFEIAELARHAAIAIGNDTGPMHIASITGCPVISLFSGHTSPEKSRPKGQNITTLQSQNIADISISSVSKAITNIL